MCRMRLASELNPPRPSHLGDIMDMRIGPASTPSSRAL
ncbi:hypothetical protein I545_5403 [Mycobacterium kansasii 662]|uniref:Uncharacterized protein n=2 Tax=Mycobacterium kansasii TaxID=1768 RepID=A0A1V3WGX7_MYCKA|nr:hypothetical protein I547_1488 [Mycobacterium kansasii 824]EUA11783.1 hypothetical protein I545_5403 [Mycobacterium kansasii 662]OOK65686.1 hypothetical protein BZL30_8507 [Mycobacterium kansasii]OOK66988.1 hypothetical protein BZL29_7085 [Mycobacterium kansasii]